MRSVVGSDRGMGGASMDSQHVCTKQRRREELQVYSVFAQITGTKADDAGQPSADPELEPAQNLTRRPSVTAGRRVR